MQKMTHLKLIAIIVLLTAECRSNIEIPDFSEQINYSYKSTVYIGNPNNHDIFTFNYFDNQGHIIEQVGREYRVKFIYNEKGQLIEKYNCRMYNCEIGWRQILKYDSLGNYIGSAIPKDTLVILSNVNVEQVKFYDKNNHLIKELSDRGADINGNKYESWKYYTYENSRITNETELRNRDTVWTGKYNYDTNGNLISIKRQNGQKYENETFQYDQLKRVTKKSIENNVYPLTEDVSSFSVSNNSTTFKYDDKGRVTEEITYNHLGKEYRRFVYEYQQKA
jgi:YD repeat-containing protein